jgi:hypothetical protein
MKKIELEKYKAQLDPGEILTQRPLPWKKFGIDLPEPNLVRETRELRLQYIDGNGEKIVGSTELANYIFQSLIDELGPAREKVLQEWSVGKVTHDEVSGFIKYSTEKLKLYNALQPSLPKHIFTSELPIVGNIMPIVKKIEIDFNNPIEYVGAIALDDLYRANGGDGLPLFAILRSVVKDLGIAGTIPNLGAVPVQILYNELAIKHNKPLLNVPNSAKAFYTLSNDWNYNWEGSKGMLGTTGNVIVTDIDQYLNPIGVRELFDLLGLLPSGSIKRSTFDTMAGAAAYYRIKSDENLADGLIGHRHVPNIPEELINVSTAPVRKITEFVQRSLGLSGGRH